MTIGFVGVAAFLFIKIRSLVFSFRYVIVAQFSHKSMAFLKLALKQIIAKYYMSQVMKIAWLFSFYGTIFLSKRVCSCYCPLQYNLQIKWVLTCATLPLPKGKIKYGGIPKKWKKLFTQSRKSEATLTTRFPV